MSSSINLNLTGVGDEIAAAAVDAIRKQQATSESSVLIGKEIAKQIGKEVSEHVAVALKTALADLQKPALDLREQILANAKFILASHQGRTPFEGGRSERGRPEHSITVVMAQYGSHVLASVVSLNEPMGAMDAPVLALLTGQPDASATDALQGLLEVLNLAVARVYICFQEQQSAGLINHSSKQPKIICSE